jgi:hypothetical protein
MRKIIFLVALFSSFSSFARDFTCKFEFDKRQAVLKIKNNQVASLSYGKVPHTVHCIGKVSSHDLNPRGRGLSVSIVDWSCNPRQSKKKVLVGIRFIKPMESKKIDLEFRNEETLSVQCI